MSLGKPVALIFFGSHAEKRGAPKQVEHVIRAGFIPAIPINYDRWPLGNGFLNEQWAEKCLAVAKRMRSKRILSVHPFTKDVVVPEASRLVLRGRTYQQSACPSSPYTLGILRKAARLARKYGALLGADCEDYVKRKTATQHPQMYGGDNKVRLVQCECRGCKGDTWAKYSAFWKARPKAFQTPYPGDTARIHEVWHSQIGYKGINKGLSTVRKYNSGLAGGAYQGCWPRTSAQIVPLAEQYSARLGNDWWMWVPPKTRDLQGARFNATIARQCRDVM